MLENLVNDVADAVGVTVAGDLCAWSNDAWIAHVDACREIITRLRDAGISDITIYNAIVREPNERAKLR